MKIAFGWNFLAWAMWGLFILACRFVLERRRQIVEEERTLHSIEASLFEDNTLTGGSFPEANNAL